MPIIKLLLTILFLVSAFASTTAIFLESWSVAGPLNIACLLIAAWRFKISDHLHGFSFTFVILAAVCASLYYPEVFTGVGDFNFKSLIVPLLMLIMFGMGTSLSISQFRNVVTMPKGVLVGLICQFTIMPVLGFTLAAISNLPPEIAAGLILVGCSPSGLASNVMAYISGANLALSLTLTAASTVIAPFLTPLYMSFLAGEYVPIDAASMFLSISKIVLLPIAAGLLFNHYLQGKFPVMDRLMPKLSMLGIALIITVITAAGRESLLSIGGLLIALVVVHNISGFALGYGSARLFKMDEPSSRTIAFEVGMQNAGLASGIAVEMGRVASMGLAPAVFGPVMNISGSSLAAWWKGSKKHD